MITPIDLANALQDLTTTIRMSYVDRQVIEEIDND